MWTIVITVEALSLFIAFTRWSMQKEAGVYQERPSHEMNDDTVAFFGHLVCGLIPLVGAAVLLGIVLQRHVAHRDAEAKRIASEERELDRVLETK